MAAVYGSVPTGVAPWAGPPGYTPRMQASRAPAMAVRVLAQPAGTATQVVRPFQFTPRRAPATLQAPIVLPKHGVSLGAAPWPVAKTACVAPASMAPISAVPSGVAPTRASLSNVLPAGAVAACVAPASVAPASVARVSKAVDDCVPTLDDAVRHHQDRAKSPLQWDGSYKAMLEALQQLGVFQNLPLDGAGTLHVSLPFAANLSEAPVLLPFLNEVLLKSGAAKEISAFGGDIVPAKWFWTLHGLYASHLTQGQMQLNLQEEDLTQAMPSPAGLLLGVHPVVSQGGIWIDIITKCVRSLMPGGRAVFATFYDFECEALEKILQSIAAKYEVHENPFYRPAGRTDGATITFTRFLVIVTA